MSLTVVFRETALRGLARIRSEDKDLFTRTRQAIALLADQPYPENAAAWSATGVLAKWPITAPRSRPVQPPAGEGRIRGVVCGSPRQGDAGHRLPLSTGLVHQVIQQEAS